MTDSGIAPRSPLDPTDVGVCAMFAVASATAAATAPRSSSRSSRLIPSNADVTAAGVDPQLDTAIDLALEALAAAPPPPMPDIGTAPHLGTTADDT